MFGRNVFMKASHEQCKKAFIFALLLLILPRIFYFSQTIKPNFLFTKSSINPMLEYFFDTMIISCKVNRNKLSSSISNQQIMKNKIKKINDTSKKLHVSSKKGKTLLKSNRVL